jgi:exopolyphosphatase/guanosine-5'-triphosphate,3'-diphosphate pyrophosphatase
VRVAVVDMGTNSTRLLVADVDDGRVTEIERRSTVTRLGRGVDTTHQLATEAIEDVADAVGEYIALYEALEPDSISVLATSAVRDAENSGAFIAELRERFALNARILTGAEEARLTYLGAVTGRPPADGTLVVDIGGGSTEIVVGSGQEMTFHSSLQVGTVRHTERHIRDDPPTAPELEALAEDIRKLLFAELAAA